MYPPTIVRARMVQTPWGRGSELRSRKLDARPRQTPEEAARNQRERLYGAMVACCVEQGYAATTVADLLALAGVSRRDFYKHFADKEACFLATLEEILLTSVKVVSRRSAGAEGGRGRAWAALEAFVDVVVSQPAAARVSLVESYAAGPAATSAVERAVEGFEGVIRQVFEEIRGKEGMPPQLVRGFVGAFYKVFHTRVYRGDVEELPELAPKLLEWALSYEPPPRPLSRGRRLRSTRSSPPPFVPHDPAERIVRAMASTVVELGYPATGIAEIVKRASMSQSTFYAHFSGKEDAMLAALDSSGAQMLAATLPAVRRAPDWPHAVRAAYAAMCGFLAAEPDFAHLRSVEVYTAGPRALEVRDRVGRELLEALLSPELDGPAGVDPLIPETIGGAIYALLYDRVRDGEPDSLPELVPFMTYITLCPFIGAEKACEVANDGEGRR